MSPLLPFTKGKVENVRKWKYSLYVPAFSLMSYVSNRNLSEVQTSQTSSHTLLQIQITSTEIIDREYQHAISDWISLEKKGLAA